MVFISNFAPRENVQKSTYSWRRECLTLASTEKSPWVIFMGLSEDMKRTLFYITPISLLRCRKLEMRPTYGRQIK